MVQKPYFTDAIEAIKLIRSCFFFRSNKDKERAKRRVELGLSGMKIQNFKG